MYEPTPRSQGEMVGRIKGREARRSLGQHVVREAGGTLNFNSNGLNDKHINDDNRNDNVAVAMHKMPDNADVIISHLSTGRPGNPPQA
jgi:hypothetical protein